MDTIIFVKDRDWPGTDSRVYEIQVSNLVAICVSCWVLLEDGRFSGDVLPDKGLRERYFALYEHGGEQANWDAFIDDLWQTADDMGLEELSDWFADERPHHHQCPLLDSRRRRILGRRAHHAKERNVTCLITKTPKPSRNNLNLPL